MAHEARLEKVRISNPDKILYPQLGISKLEVAQYYEWIAPHMLEELRSRPLMLVRCPAGQKSQCFFQKHPRPAGDPSGRLLTVADSKELVQLAQMNVLEIHCWGARKPHLDRPDRVVFDLDPHQSVPFKAVIEAARLLRELLRSYALHPFVRSTGGKGLHIVAPLEARHDWAAVKSFARAVAQSFAAEDPKLYTAASSLRQRPGRIYIDYLRNGKGATSIANYSLRAKPGASIAVPLRWTELNDDFRPDRYNILNIRRRLSKKYVDPWREMRELRGRLPNLH